MTVSTRRRYKGTERLSASGGTFRGGGGGSLRKRKEKRKLRTYYQAVPSQHCQICSRRPTNESPHVICGKGVPPRSAWEVMQDDLREMLSHTNIKTGNLETGKQVDHQLAAMIALRIKNRLSILSAQNIFPSSRSIVYGSRLHFTLDIKPPRASQNCGDYR